MAKISSLLVEKQKLKAKLNSVQICASVAKKLTRKILKFRMAQLAPEMSPGG